MEFNYGRKHFIQYEYIVKGLEFSHLKFFPKPEKKKPFCFIFKFCCWYCVSGYLVLANLSVFFRWQKWSLIYLAHLLPRKHLITHLLH